MTDEAASQALRQRVSEALRRIQEIERLLAEPEVVTDVRRLEQLGREQAQLAPIAERGRALAEVERQIEDGRSLLGESDQDLRALAEAEVVALGQRRGDLVRELLELLHPQDDYDRRDVILEIRAGTGGDEASLFAGDLLRMYLRYADARGWSAEILSSSQSDLGGYKEVIIDVAGRGAYSRLRFESGVHRVQRVPITEAGGRIHTSTATVAVLPKPDEVEVQIDEEDLRIDVFRSQGHGGQSVNTTDSAVRLTHLPTGIVVTCQDERSQLKNKVRAMDVLRARLFAIQQREQHDQMATMRRSQVGTGERAEKIRTYNFRENRVTEHRIGLTVHRLESILEGQLDPVIEPLLAAAKQEQA